MVQPHLYVKKHYVTIQCCSTRSLVYSNIPMKTMSFNMLHGCLSLLPYNFIMHIWFHIHVSFHQYMGGMKLASIPLDLVFIIVDCTMLG
jgi:hypothetical protein